MLGFGRKQFQVKDKHCYIGGGSEGLGLALACQLAERGAHVTIVSRSASKLEKALNQVEQHRQSPNQKLASYSCDLTSAKDAAETVTRACQAHHNLAPDYIFACAGGCTPRMFLEAEVDDHMKALEWNFKTALCTVHEGVKMMKEQGRKGKIVFTTSVLSMFGFAGYSTYCPSKFAIRGLADALRNELIMYDIDVSVFIPASIFSPGFENEQAMKSDITKRIEGPDDGVKPEQAARYMIKGLERNEYYITYEPVGHMLRTSRGGIPGNNYFLDVFWGFAGNIVMPLWRFFLADSQVRKERAKLRKRAS
ncbi:3-dehydrosphinganine reductase [Microbotryomycetes sp. JL201]|nr:3-dehydrosphinganine reductase [Microbotryomycetes sp. JL201]